ncbi:MAG: iron ABC transporter permease [Bacteroidales bacterium]|nr:iron ABC transporter permease [Bacteroidales bacterium]
MKNKDIVYCSILFIAVICLGITASVLGSVDISKMTEADKYILYQIRIPRTLMCMVTGSTLAVCGCAYQAVFKNPLSDPYILGVSSGASLGASLAIVLGFDFIVLGVTLSSFLTALLTVFLIMKLSQVGSRMHTTTLLLAGISMNFLISAIISIIMFIDQEDMHKIYFWTMGSLSGIKYSDVIITALFSITGITFMRLYAKRLNVLLLGDMQANSLGVDVEKTKRTILIISTLMTAAVVSHTGVIGFVGLVVPHIVRLVVGGDNRRIIPFSVLGGMIFMLLADIIARNVVSPSELPIGSITSLVGAPFFIYLLYNAKKKLHF